MLSSSMTALIWGSLLRITFFLLLIATVVFGFFTLPVEKGRCIYSSNSLGFSSISAYSYLRAVLGGEYLFGLPVGFVADSIGATVGAGAAFLLGRTPITLALVYVGTTLKDLSDVTHGWSEFSTTHWVFIVLGLLVSVVLMFCVTKVAKSALDKALAENEDLDFSLASPQLPIVVDTPVNLNQPLLIKIDPSEDQQEK